MYGGFTPTRSRRYRSNRCGVHNRRMRIDTHLRARRRSPQVLSYAESRPFRLAIQQNPLRLRKPQIEPVVSDFIRWLRGRAKGFSFIGARAVRGFRGYPLTGFKGSPLASRPPSGASYRGPKSLPQGRVFRHRKPSLLLRYGHGRSFRQRNQKPRLRGLAFCTSRQSRYDAGGRHGDGAWSGVNPSGQTLPSRIGKRSRPCLVPTTDPSPAKPRFLRRN